MEVFIEQLQPTDLEAINKLTMREYAESDLYTFSAKLIDDKPTRNGRIWSKEWQAAHVKDFVGKPITVDHENRQSVVLGRIFKAEQKDNAIFARAYVPVTTEAGQKAREQIESGLFKSVSIEAWTDNVKAEGKYTRILPGKTEVLAVSFVAIPGCATCEVSKESACQSESLHAGSKADNDTKAESQVVKDDPWIVEARAAHAERVNEYVRLACFIHGPTNVDKSAYQRMAESADPATLRTMTNDLQRLYDQRNGAQQVTETVTTEVTQAIKNIRKAKGV